MALHTDVAGIDAALARAHELAGLGDTRADHEAAAALRQAVDLYRGDLLEGCDDEWVEEPRERLRARQADALHRLTAMLERHPHQPEALRRLLAVQRRQAKPAALLGLLPELRKHKVIEEAELRELEREAWAARLNEVGRGGEAQALRDTWPLLSSSLQHDSHLLGLYAEQLSGTAFTAPRHENRRSWLYRMRPSAEHPPFTRYEGAGRFAAETGSAPLAPNRLRWGPVADPAPNTDLIDGMTTMLVNRAPEDLEGVAVHVYAANADMDRRVFFDADGELLFTSSADPTLVYRNQGAITVAAGGTEPITIVAESPGAAYNVAGSTLVLATPQPALAFAPSATDQSWITTAGAGEFYVGALGAIECRFLECTFDNVKVVVPPGHELARSEA